jgi:hypothetical protein
MLSSTLSGNLYNSTSFAPQTILVLYIKRDYYHLVLPFKESNFVTLLRPFFTSIVWRCTLYNSFFDEMRLRLCRLSRTESCGQLSFIHAITDHCLTGHSPPLFFLENLLFRSTWWACQVAPLYNGYGTCGVGSFRPTVPGSTAVKTPRQWIVEFNNLLCQLGSSQVLSSIVVSSSSISGGYWKVTLTLGLRRRRLRVRMTVSVSDSAAGKETMEE